MKSTTKREKLLRHKIVTTIDVVTSTTLSRVPRLVKIRPDYTRNEGGNLKNLRYSGYTEIRRAPGRSLHEG